MVSRKIVTTAGGRRYTANAYASIRLLRYLGCDLPVDWFYVNDLELPEKWVAAVETIPGVKCFNLNLTNNVNSKRAAGGWQAKIESILATDADEVLYLDADNFVRRDPEYLFNSDLFKEYGAILWPDGWVWEEKRRKDLENYFGVTIDIKHQTESGQLLFDKRRCKLALERTREYNINSDEIYEIVYGDKDTFYFGFMTTNTPFTFIKTLPQTGHGCLLQHDMYGDIIFTHLTGGKWALNGRPFTTEASLPHLNKCREFIADLRELLK